MLAMADVAVRLINVGRALRRAKNAFYFSFICSLVNAITVRFQSSSVFTID